MKLSTTIMATLGFVAQLAYAQIRLTEPLGETSWDASKANVVQWRPTKGASLSDLGSLDLTLWAGSKESRINVMSLGTVDATARRLPLTAISPSLGPAGDYYFIRLYSATKDKTYESGKFTLTGMSGAFNATMEVDIQKDSPLIISNNSSTPSPPGVSVGARPSALDSNAQIVSHRTSGSARSATPVLAALGVTMFASAFAVFAC